MSIIKQINEAMKLLEQYRNKQLIPVEWLLKRAKLCTVNYADWNPFSPTSPLNVMRPAETLAVHIWKVNTEGIIPDATIVSAATSALLVIVVIVFNLGARYLGNKLYRKLTAAK